MFYTRKMLLQLCFLTVTSTEAFVPRLAGQTLRATSMTSTTTTSLRSSPTFDYCLLFDCDGVILETEELHRVAYNAAFREFGLTIDNQQVKWSVDYYDRLQNTVGGGKPKMWYYFTNTTGNVWPSIASDNNSPSPPPDTNEEQQALIDQLQTWKTAYYQTLLEQEAIPRPGVVELMDQALADPRIAVGVCSAATREAAAKTLALTLGDVRVTQLDVCLLGDDVSAKKPDPLIYTTAAAQVGVEPARCMVVEDSLIGVQAAVAAGMTCIVTYTSSTQDVDFYDHGAAAKMPSLASVTLEGLFGPWRNQGVDAEILVDIRDPLVTPTCTSTVTTAEEKFV